MRKRFSLVVLMALVLLVAIPKVVLADDGASPEPFKPITLLLEIADLHFTNKSNETIVINYVDKDGNEKLSYTWKAGENGTFPIWNFSAPLIARDQDGNIVKVYIPTGEKNQSFVINQALVDWAKTVKIASYPSLKSLSSDFSRVNVVFVNKSTIPLNAYWMDFEGKEKAAEPAVLEAGKNFPANSGFMHAWRFRDQFGNVIMEYINSEAAKQTVTITNEMVIASYQALLAK